MFGFSFYLSILFFIFAVLGGLILLFLRPDVVGVAAGRIYRAKRKPADSDNLYEYNEMQLELRPQTELEHYQKKKNSRKLSFSELEKINQKIANPFKRNLFFGFVKGPSMEFQGMYDSDLFLGTRNVTPYELQKGDIIVLECDIEEYDNLQSIYKLRLFDGLTDDGRQTKIKIKLKNEFGNIVNGIPHDSDKLVAKVTKKKLY